MPIVNVAAVLAKHCCSQDVRLVVVPLKESYLERLGNHKKHLGFPRPDSEVNSKNTLLTNVDTINTHRYAFVYGLAAASSR